MVKRQRSGRKVGLGATCLMSFCCTSMLLVTLPLPQPRNQHSSRRRRPGMNGFRRGRLPNSALGNDDEEPARPVVKPSDFDRLNILQFGDTVYEFGGAWDLAPVVVESHKLLFWTTPKVACTVFKKAFRRMEGYKDWMEENDVLPHSPYSNGLKYLYHYRPEEADAMLTDPSWTRAIFVRDPKQRLLSAYLDKVVSNEGRYVRKMCCKMKSMEVLLECDKFRIKTQVEGMAMSYPKLRNPVVSFAEFLKNVYSACADPHWQPQSDRLPDKYWPVINFVGHLEKAKADTERLFRKIGAWEPYGASGWPSGSIFSGNKAKHATFAKQQMSKYYTPELEKLVERLLKSDYDHHFLNLTVIQYSDS